MKHNPIFFFVAFPVLVCCLVPSVAMGGDPVGACCFALGTPGAGCLDVTQSECDTYPLPRVWQSSVTCSTGGCEFCLGDYACQDGDPCSLNVCNLATGRCLTYADHDGDHDGVRDCDDGCPYNPALTEPGPCGCSTSDQDHDGLLDCVDRCPDVPGRVCDNPQVPATSDWSIPLLSLGLLIGLVAKTRRTPARRGSSCP